MITSQFLGPITTTKSQGMTENCSEVTARLRAENRALAAQLRECAETLAADQIDEHRAMRAYADAIALLEKLPHL